MVERAADSAIKEVSMNTLSVVTQTVVAPPPDFLSLLYFALAALITLGIETLRRYVKRRMDIWESQHELPEKSKKSEED